MLTALHIRDFVLIDSATLPIGTGLTVLTGETGAGKSILLEALGLAVGGRASRGSVRAGAQEGVVTAAFAPARSHPAWRLLTENGIAADDEQIILRRHQSADGRGRAFINDQPTSVGLLRTVGETLLEIHGQHDGHSFLSAATHRALLDEYGALAKLSADTAEAHWAWRRIDEERAAQARTRNDAAREADYLRHVVGELQSLDPQSGEEAQLSDRRAVLMASGRIFSELSAVSALLSEDGLQAKAAAAAHRLARTARTLPTIGAGAHGEGPLDAVIARIDRFLEDLMETEAAVEEARERLAFEPGSLEAVDERLYALRAAARKHGVAPDALPSFRKNAEAALLEIENSEIGFADLERRTSDAHAVFLDLAKDLSRARRDAGIALDAAVARELAPLKLARASFLTHIASDDSAPGPHGIDHVEFMVATNPGLPPGPLKSIASGGELSRFVLAMKAALAAKENRTVIIFDEVDSGVGGAVADAVGERLAKLARGAQVLVVTHSPQVAARAVNHWLVEKTQRSSETRTQVRVLTSSERIEEIARMLSGATISDEARAAAAKLLGADAPPAKVKPRRRGKAG